VLPEALNSLSVEGQPARRDDLPDDGHGNDQHGSLAWKTSIVCSRKCRGARRTAPAGRLCTWKSFTRPRVNDDVIHEQALSLVPATDKERETGIIDSCGGSRHLTRHHPRAQPLPPKSTFLNALQERHQPGSLSF
jgi:hypothetical protein